MDKLRCYITEASIPIPMPSRESLDAKRKSAEKAAAERLRQKRAYSMNKQNKKVEF